MMLSPEKRVKFLVAFEAIINIFIWDPFFLGAERWFYDFSDFLIHLS